MKKQPSKNSAAKLSEHVKIRGRFHRSTNIVEDWYSPTATSDYLVTPSIRGLAERIISGLFDPELATRTWSLAGPYGSGKSSFILFLCDVLSKRNQSHALRNEVRRDLRISRRKRFLPILLTAERGPLTRPLLTAVLRSLREFDSSLAAQASKLRRRQSISSEDIATLLRNVADHPALSESFGGVVLVIDELGKFLEFAADQPAEADVFILQQLAETVSRSSRPFLFITVLHSGFADYLPPGDEIRRAEWQKVQGRFQDMAFQLPAEQMLGLVDYAVQQDPPTRLSTEWKKVVSRAVRSHALEDARARIPLRELLSGSLPLHPVTTLLLWPLFRSKVAQNERSLFAFLTGKEPHAFASFLEREDASTNPLNLYSVPDLYDYTVSSLGLATFRGQDARRWSLIADAIDRIPASSPPATAEVVKTIGLIDLYGASIGLRASRETLELVMDAEANLDNVLGLLEELSIIVYRKYRGGYGLWEGSDVDLDKLFEQASRQVGSGSLHERLGRSITLAPTVAKAHYSRTGTMRVFEARFIPATADGIKSEIDRKSPYDGKILFALPEDGLPMDSVRAEEIVKQHHIAENFLVAFPQDIRGINSALTEVETWRLLSLSAYELQGDSVARTEVRARLSQALDRLEPIVGQLFGLFGHPIDPSASTWFRANERIELASSKELQNHLTNLCDQIYSEAPRLHNELLNRRKLSSAASAARRVLVERVLSDSSHEKLGIEGTPPEVSMYFSMVHEGGFHRKNGRDTYELRVPRGTWKPAWKAIEDFVESTRTGKRSLQELYERLRGPPYGLLDGPLPVLLAVYLTRHQVDVSLYEDGVFVPGLRAEVFDRLIKRPETFELQSHKLDRQQQVALQSLYKIRPDLLPDESNSSSAKELVPAARGIVTGMGRLNAYSKNTRAIGAKNAAVRDTVLQAVDPKELLFSDLPSVLGIDTTQRGWGNDFAPRLVESIRDITRAYVVLLDDIESQIRDVFGLGAKTKNAPRVLAKRMKAIERYATESQVKLLVRELANPSTERDWREMAGYAVMGGKPPAVWNDNDAADFQVRLQDTASQVFRLEELVAERGDAESATVFRVGVLDDSLSEARAVIDSDLFGSGEVEELATRLAKVLRAWKGSNNNSYSVRVAALARTAHDILSRK